MIQPLNTHSIQTLGCVNGPGLRMVVFCKGCPLSCAYCHNPDTRSGKGGTPLPLEDFVHRLKRSRPYLGKKGGVTFSGGEPLAQAAQLIPFLQHAKDQGVHTAIDTAGLTLTDSVKAAVALSDLVLLDVKHADKAGFHQLTKGNLEQTLGFLDFCVLIAKPVWIRQVIVPGITMNEQQINLLADLLDEDNRRRVIQRIELLPFHRTADHKYEKMGWEFPLSQTPAADPEEVNVLARVLVGRGFPVPAVTTTLQPTVLGIAGT